MGPRVGRDLRPCLRRSPMAQVSTRGALSCGALQADTGAVFAHGTVAAVRRPHGKPLRRVMPWSRSSVPHVAPGSRRIAREDAVDCGVECLGAEPACDAAAALAVG